MNFKPLLILPLFLTVASCQKERSIVILHDNDVHCAIEGYLPFAGYKRAVIDADTAYVATVSSGDYVQGGSLGSVSRGSYIIDMMNAVGYDVVTLGNHEFDYGGERMQELMSSLKAEVVSANVSLAGEVQTLYAPFTLRRYGNRTVGFVGATTPGAAVSEAYTFFDKQGNPVFDAHEDEVTLRVQQAVDEARAQGADYVILLSHLGEVPVLSYVNTTELIAQTRGIDAVLEGHTHNLIVEQWIDNANGKPVLLTETGTRFSHIGKLVISPDGTLHAECIPVDQVSGLHDARTDSVMAVIDAEVSGLMEQKLIHSGFPLFANDAQGNRIIRCSETNLGDLVSDAMRVVTGTQIALMNGGGIRADIAEGDVKYMHVNDVLPFSNSVLTLYMTGQQIVDLLEWTCQDLPEMSGNFMQASGLRYTADCRYQNQLSVDEEGVLIVEGKRRVIKVEVLDGDRYLPIDPHRKYLVTTIEYISNTGRAFPTMVPLPHVNDDLMGDIECLIQYLNMMDGEMPERYRKPDGEGRIKILK